MTTSQANNDFEFVDASIRLAKRHVKLAEACSAVLILIAYTLIALTAVVLADHAKTGGLSAEARLHVRLIYAVGAAALLAWLAIAPMVRRLNDLFAARTIERHHPEYRNSVISALQLAWREELPGSIRSALASRAAGDLARTDLWAAIDKRPIQRAATAVGAASALFLLYAALAPKPIWPSIRRALGFELPAPTRTQIIIEEPPADFETLPGSPVRMVARITGRRPDQAFVRFSLDGGATWQPDQQLSLSPPPTVATADPQEQKRWRAVKPGREVQQSMAYQFVAGDARSEIRTLRIRHYPQVADVRVRCEYPDYTRLAPTEHQGGNVTAVIGTRVGIRVQTTVPAEPPLMLVFRKTDRGRILIQPADDGATIFEGRFRVEADDEYTIDYRDRYGVRNRDPIVHTIKAVPDEPPRIELERPADGIRLAMDEAMHLACRVTDDFGLTDVALMYQTDQPEHVSKIPLLAEQTNTPRALLIERAIPLSRMSAQPGQEITWWVSAQDNRHNARDVAAYQVTESEKRHIIVKAGEPGQRPGHGTVTSRRTNQPGPKSAAESKPSEAEGQVHAEDSRPTSLPAGSQAKVVTVRAPGSQPADDLTGFVEQHHRELAALEKHLESDPAPSKQEGPTNSTQPSEVPSGAGGAQAEQRDAPAESVSQSGSQKGDSQSNRRWVNPSRVTAGRNDPPYSSSEESRQGQAEKGRESADGESGKGQGQAGTGSADAKDGSESGAEGQGSASSGESAAGSKGSEASSGKGKGDSDAASEQDQKSGEGEGQGDGAGQGKSGEGSSQASKTSSASSGEGKGSATSDTGGGVRDPGSSSDGPPTSLPTTRPQFGSTGDLAQTSQGRPARSPTVDRAEKLVNELERQLRRGQVDLELLSDLKWTPEQAQQFVHAFREIEERTPSPDSSIDTTASREPIATRQPGTDQWRSAGGRDRGVRGAIVIDQREADQVNRLLEVRRQQVGREYRPLLEAYYKTVAAYRAPVSQPAGASR